jgi:hypothetical protein
LLSAVMCIAKQAQYSKMSDYRPKLPSNNAYDYYITAARQLKGGEHFSNQQPPTQERRWIEANQGAFNTLRGALGNLDAPSSTPTSTPHCATWRDW